MKVGDIVLCDVKELPVFEPHDLPDKVPGICVYHSGEDDFGIEFYTDISGHTCGGLGKENRCWYVGLEALEIVEEI